MFKRTKEETPAPKKDHFIMIVGFNITITMKDGEVKKYKHAESFKVMGDQFFRVDKANGYDYIKFDEIKFIETEDITEEREV